MAPLGALLSRAVGGNVAHRSRRGYVGENGALEKSRLLILLQNSILRVRAIGLVQHNCPLALELVVARNMAHRSRRGDVGENGTLEKGRPLILPELSRLRPGVIGRVQHDCPLD
jgi:hypothetical protein